MANRPIERGHPSLHISTRFPLPLKEEIEAEAKRRGITPSELIRQAVSGEVGYKSGESETAA